MTANPQFVFDNNVGPPLAMGMRAFGEGVQHLQDLFPAVRENVSLPDIEWLEVAGRQGLVVVTRDAAIRLNPAEREAFVRFRVGAFFLRGKALTRCAMIQQIVRNWPTMKELARKTERPFGFFVPQTGKIDAKRDRKL